MRGELWGFMHKGGKTLTSVTSNRYSALMGSSAPTKPRISSPRMPQSPKKDALDHWYEVLLFAQRILLTSSPPPPQNFIQTHLGELLSGAF